MLFLINLCLMEVSNITQILKKTSYLYSWRNATTGNFTWVYIYIQYITDCKIKKTTAYNCTCTFVSMMKFSDIVPINVCYWPSYTLWYAKWRYNKNNKCTAATTEPAISPWRRLNVRLINTVTCSRIQTDFFNKSKLYHNYILLSACTSNV